MNISTSNLAALRSLHSRPQVPQAPPAGQPALVDPVAKLTADWGKTGSNFDLNKDGTVDGGDLGILLSRLNQPAKPGSVEASPLDQLLADWGKTNSKFDLNADGNVDGSDLGLLLGGQEPVEDAVTPQPAQDDTSDLVTLLQAEWGKSGSKFDINSDGTVDGADLGLLLGGAQPKDDVPVTALTADDILKSWGSNDAAADLNADGVVDGADLGLALAADAPAPEAVPAEPPVAEAAASVPDRIANAVLSTRDHDGDGLLSAAELGVGSTLFKNLDLDGDGLVSASDLRLAISRQLDSATKNQPNLDINRFEQRWLAALQPKTSSTGNEVAGLADDLISRLNAAGFGSTPPNSLRRLVDGLNLSDQQSRSLLGRLARHYPPGSRINASA